MRLGVHVVPTEHPDQGVVPEAVIDVLPYLETTAELVPRTSHGRFGAKHQVAIDNRGNVPVTVLLIPVAGSDALTVTAQPESLTVDPGQAAFSDIHARPAGRLWRGVPLMLPFSLTVAPQGSPEVQLEAGHVQDPILPKWLPKALLALLALLLLLLAFWYLLMRPAVVAAAQEAVAEPVQSAQADAAAAKQASDQATAAKTGSDKAAAAAKTEAGKSATSARCCRQERRSDASRSPKFVTLPFSERLSVEARAGQRDADPFELKSNETLALTDFVLENTQGDSGVLTILRNDRVLLTQALESFRTTDYHFVTPFVAQPGDILYLRLQCNEPGTPPAVTPPPTTCSNALTFGGEMTTETGAVTRRPHAESAHRKDLAIVDEAHLSSQVLGERRFVDVRLTDQR